MGKLRKVLCGIPKIDVVVDINKEESETEDDLLPLKDYGITCNKKMIDA